MSLGKSECCIQCNGPGCQEDLRLTVPPWNGQLDQGKLRNEVEGEGWTCGPGPDDHYCPACTKNRERNA